MELLPGKRIGPFVFEQPLPSSLGERIRRVGSEDLGEIAWDEYEYADVDAAAYAVFVEDGVVSHVDCHERCVVDGHNLLGMRISEVERVLALIAVPEAAEEMSSGPQTVFSFDALGLQLWLKDGVVVTVQCSAP